MVISASFVVATFSREIILVMADKEFFESHRIVPIILLAYVFLGWALFSDTGTYISGASKYITLIAVVVTFAVLVLYRLLIPSYGIYGAAWATVGAMFTRFAMFYICSQKLYPFTFGWNRIVRLMLIAVALFVLSSEFNGFRLSLAIAFKTLTVAAYLVICYLAVLREEERSMARRYIRDILARVFPGRAWAK